MKQFSSIQTYPQINFMFSKYLVTQKKMYHKFKCLFLAKLWWQSASLTDDSILHITAYD